LNDPEKNGKGPGIPQKEGKFGNFHSIILILKKKNCIDRFACFYKEKNIFYFIYYFQELTKNIS